MQRLLLAVIALGAFLAGCAGNPPPAPQQRTIAITFDDAPLPDGPFHDGTVRTRRLIESLEAAGVEEAMIFVTTNNIVNQPETGVERIRAYQSAGHLLGNHSHSHLWLHDTDTDIYIADIDKAVSHLWQFDGVSDFYRYPYLDEGRDVQKRDLVRAALKERQLRNGYVTVDTWDWYFVDMVREAKAAGLEGDMDALRDLYVDVIVRSTEFYDAMAQRTLGRSPHHVLLLHENDMAAMFVDDLVAELRRRNFEIIPASEAFTDPIAEREPDTLYLGQGRIAALAHEAGADPATLKSPTEDKEYLRRRFEKEVLRLGER